MKITGIAIRNISRNVRRSILSVTATLVATMAIVVLFSFIGGIRQNIGENVSDFISGNVRIRNTEYDANEYMMPIQFRIQDPQPLVRKIESEPGVTSVVERIPFGAGVYRENDTVPIQGLGVDFAAEKGFMKIDRLLHEGKLPEAGKNEVVLGPTLAKELGVKVGDKITLLAQTMRRGTNAITFTVSGIVVFPLAGLNGSLILAPIDRAQRLLGMGGAATEILVKLDDPAGSRAFAKRLSSSLSSEGYPDLEAKSFDQISTILSLMTMAEVIYGFIGLFFFVLASTVLINTTMMVIYERTREIGTIGALGMTGGEIVRLFFYEALTLAVTGAVAGMIVGGGFSILLGNIGIDMSDALQGVDLSTSNIIYPRFQLGTTLLIGLYSIIISSLAAILPARRAAKIEPVEALRTI